MEEVTAIDGIGKDLEAWFTRIRSAWSRFRRWIVAVPGRVLVLCSGWWGLLFYNQDSEKSPFNGRAEVCARWGAATFGVCMVIGAFCWMGCDFKYVILWRGFLSGVVLGLSVALFMSLFLDVDGKCVID